MAPQSAETRLKPRISDLGSPVERRQVQFTGLVQGVGFRMTARAVAREMGLTGWVRNEADGSVLMHVQGPPAELDRCIQRIPQKAYGRVEGARSVPMPIEPGETGFEIRH